MQWETVTCLKIEVLVNFEAQPFKVVDDEAAILLVDSNLQREKLLPSERAYAYKLKLEALKHQILLNDVIDYNCYEVNAKQGTQIKKHYLDGDLSEDKINEILKGEESKISPVLCWTRFAFIFEVNMVA